MKKVNLGTKSTIKNTMADNWVEQRVVSDVTEPMKRLTIDIPLSLHTALKKDCAERGVKIANDVRDLLKQKYL